MRYVAVYMRLSQLDDSKTSEQISTKFSADVGHGPGRNCLDFVANLESAVDFESQCGILYR